MKRQRLISSGLAPGATSAHSVALIMAASGSEPKKQILGIDVGGSGIKGAPVTVGSGRLLAERERIETPQPATPKAVAATVRKLVKHFDWNGLVGCGFPGAIVDGVVRTATNIHESWLGENVEDLLTSATGCVTHVMNDADAAGLAEMRLGNGKGEEGTVILITVGTGIGTAVFREGVLVPNTELGSLTMDGELAEYWAADSARERLGMKWKQWRPYFFRYLDLLYELIFPDLIIVGGGISKKPDRFMPYLEIQGDVRVVPAKLKNRAGIIGAAVAALEKEMAQHPEPLQPEDIAELESV